MKAATPLLEAWERVVAADPDAPLVADGATGRWQSRAAVEARRRDWAARLPDMVTAGRPVLFQSPNGADWLGLALAIWSRGGVAIPLDPLTREGERARLTEALRPAAVVVEGQIEALGEARRFRASVVLGKLTSGSTGEPKALFFSASEMLADGRQVEAGMGIGPGDINLAVIPFGHSYGLGNLVLPAVVEGRPVACASAVFPWVLVEEAVRCRATVFPATPPLLRSILKAGLRAVDWPSLRLVITAGARLEPELARAFAAQFGRTVHNFYGSSETGGIAFDADGSLGISGAAVGRPLPGVRLETSATGRLMVSSPAVHSHRNRTRFDGRAAVVLADRGGLDARGRVVLRGRLSTLLKIGARRLDPAEIEAVFKRIPGVRDCLVGVVSAGDAEMLGAVVAGEVDRATLRLAAKSTLAAWKVPKRIRVVAEMPVTGRGKSDRGAALALLKNAG